jgi:hypothetical protein
VQVRVITCLLHIVLHIVSNIMHAIFALDTLCCACISNTALHCACALCMQDVLWWALYKAEPWLLGSWLRKTALAEVRCAAAAAAAVVAHNAMITIF